jgi:hypothetical protein
MHTIKLIRVVSQVFTYWLLTIGSMQLLTAVIIVEMRRVCSWKNLASSLQSIDLLKSSQRLFKQHKILGPKTKTQLWWKINSSLLFLKKPRKRWPLFNLSLLVIAETLPMRLIHHIWLINSESLKRLWHRKLDLIKISNNSKIKTA